MCVMAASSHVGLVRLDATRLHWAGVYASHMALAPVCSSTLNVPVSMPKTRHGICSSLTRVVYVHWMLLFGRIASFVTMTVHFAHAGARGSGSVPHATTPAVNGHAQVPGGPSGPGGPAMPCGPGGPMKPGGPARPCGPAGPIG